MANGSIKAIVAVAFGAGLAAGAYLSTHDVALLIPPAHAAQSGQGEPMISPIKMRDRDFYAPNSEDLAPDEIRVIACGTGIPTPRPAQAAACFLMELGNGDKFVFDIGDGSAERLMALQIPTAFLDKVFIGHLHADHFGDIGSMFVSMGLAGRFTPLIVSPDQAWAVNGPNRPPKPPAPGSVPDPVSDTTGLGTRPRSGLAGGTT